MTQNFITRCCVRTVLILHKHLIFRTAPEATLWDLLADIQEEHEITIIEPSGSLPEKPPTIHKPEQVINLDLDGFLSYKNLTEAVIEEIGNTDWQEVTILHNKGSSYRNVVGILLRCSVSCKVNFFYSDGKKYSFRSPLTCYLYTGFVSILKKLISILSWPITIILTAILYLYFKRSKNTDWEEEPAESVPKFPDFCSSRSNQSSVVSVCIATCGRPQMLERLLKSIDKQEFEKVEEPEVNIVIVDNDRKKTAEKVYRELSGKLDIPLNYYHEETPGIPFARNRAIAEASPGSDFIVFIDDDHYAEKQWLDELLFVHSQTEATIVTGPVVPNAEQSPPEWLKDHLLPFNRKRHFDMTSIDYARTGNVLISTKLFNEGLYFDPRFGLNGGDDSDFFKRALNKDKEIFWADNAITYEEVSEEQLTLSWQLKRSFRSSNGAMLHVIFNSDFQRNKKKYLLKTLKELNMSLVSIIFSPLYPDKGFIDRIIIIINKVGKYSAICGYRYEEYAERHE